MGFPFARGRGRVLLLAGALAAGLVGTLLPRARGEGDRSAPTALGAAACRSCHVPVHDAWSSATHANTLQIATKETLPQVAVSGGTIQHPPGTTRFLPKDGKFFAETEGPDGKPTVYPVSYVVGHRRIHMYVSTLDDGRLQVLPFMQEIPTGRFFDYTALIYGAPDGLEHPDQPPIVHPGDPSFWTGPVRSFDARCMRCHSSGFRVVDPPPARGRRTEWRGLAVDCESCHGPGADHVALHTGGVMTGEPDAMTKQRTFSRKASLDACILCHMEAEVVDPDLQPGDDALEHLDPTVYEDPEITDPYGRPLELVYAGISMLGSVCAHEGELTCLSCHDAHGTPNRASLIHPAGDDHLCSSCHAEIAAKPREHSHHDPKASGGTCVGCHMPFLQIERGHGVIADHTIGIPRLDLPGDRVAKDACTWCHGGGPGAPPGAPSLAKDALKSAYAKWWPEPTPPHPWELAVAEARLGNEDAVPALRGAAEDDRNCPPLFRATATKLIGRFPERGADHLLALAKNPSSLVRRNAIGALESVRSPAADAALLAALSDPSAPVRFRAARAVLAGYERAQQNPALLKAALPELEAQVKAIPNDDERWFRLAAARELAGDLAGAVEAYERQVYLDPFAKSTIEYLPKLRAKSGR